MGWEKRGNKEYYYAAERVGGRVVKRYVGAGMVADLASELTDLRREWRAEEAAADRQGREAVAALDEALAPLCELADAATAAAMAAAGYHRPKRGKWRKRRG